MTKKKPEPTPEENKWIATGLTIALQLIPEDREAFIRKEWKKFCDSENVYKHYNIALNDSRKAINKYLITLI